MHSMAAFRLYYVLKRWKVNNPLLFIRSCVVKDGGKCTSCVKQKQTTNDNIDSYFATKMRKVGFKDNSNITVLSSLKGLLTFQRFNT
jgi:uncharacterized protein YehS (DUF1456 family)